MAEQTGASPYTARYRDILEKRGEDTTHLTDEALTYRLGQILESKGELDSLSDPKFKSQYLDIKNRPDPEMQGILGYPKELYRSARMSTLGMASSAFSAAAIPLLGREN